LTKWKYDLNRYYIRFLGPYVAYPLFPSSFLIHYPEKEKI
jgi:hypothetical protein